MNLFTENVDFYPTPESVINTMLLGENIVGKTILEPSAGKGDIVKWLKSNGAGEVIACEKEKYLQKLLVGELQKYYWRIIFNKLNMEKYATQELRNQINKFIEKQSNVPFTMHNIYQVINMVIQTTGQRMNKALEETFDMICSFSAENSTAGEKWKTNANYIVNKKFIVPYMTSYDSRYNNTHVRLSYSGNEVKINDVVKALCYVNGVTYDEKQSLRNFIYDGMYYGEWYEWSFFRIKAFKKGTMHFEFLDKNVWIKFNQAVAKQRGWVLPKKSKKK